MEVIKEALTFDDVLLVPRYSSVLPSETNLNIEIEKNVYSGSINADIIVSRAFKKLAEIISISREIIKKPHRMFILKGKSAQDEINKLSLGQNYSYKLERSITDVDSKIITVEVT